MLFRSEQGRIYVVYPIPKLAQTLGCSFSSITRSLTELTNAGLIERTRSGFSKPSRIFLKIPHTAQEALIAELLGDVGILTDNIKSLREALPFLVEDVSTRLRGESSRFIEAADRLTAVLDAIVQYVDSHAEQAVQAEVDKIKAELRLSLNAVAAEALRGAIGQEILTVLRKIEDAGMSFSQEVNKSSEVMSRHRRSSSVAVMHISG